MDSKILFFCYFSTNLLRYSKRTISDSFLAHLALCYHSYKSVVLIDHVKLAFPAMIDIHLCQGFKT